MKLLLALCTVWGTAAFAGPIGVESLTFDFFDFDTFQDGEQVLSFYDGGLGGLGSGPGPSFGVSFTNGLAVTSPSITPGPSAILTAPSVTMSLDDPWDGVISFYFAGTGAGASFYSGSDGNGTLVASYSLTSDPFLTFTFAEQPGAFRSVVFIRGEGLQLDSITFSPDFSGVVVSEPSSLTLMCLGIVSIAGIRRLFIRARPRPSSGIRVTVR